MQVDGTTTPLQFSGYQAVHGADDVTALHFRARSILLGFVVPKLMLLFTTEGWSAQPYLINFVSLLQPLYHLRGNVIFQLPSSDFGEVLPELHGMPEDEVRHPRVKSLSRVRHRPVPQGLRQLPLHRILAGPNIR